MTTLTFIERKLLKDLLSTCDSYYRTNQLKSCVNSLHMILARATVNAIKHVMDIEYYKDLVFPFYPEPNSPNFAPYCNLNKRMGENMDWHCNDGTILCCLKQIYSDFLKSKWGIRNIIF